MEASELFFLDPKERELVLDGVRRVRELDADRGDVLAEHLKRLARVSDVIRTSPPIARTPIMPRRASWSSDTLVDVLCKVPDYDFELHIPTKAVLGQAWLIAKINFFKALGYALEGTDAPATLVEQVHNELGQSIYSKLAEELFISIVTDPTGDRPVKVLAAEALFRIWEERLDAEIDDFAPVLESIWQARNAVRPVLGTMRGTQEFFRLMQAACDERFVDYFTGDVPEEERQAFDEFLFGISTEEIGKLRDHLDQGHCAAISPEQAKKVLGRNDSWSPSEEGPQALYTSYKRRRVKAHYRELTNVPGPKKTAEEYVMIAFIKSGIR